ILRGSASWSSDRAIRAAASGFSHTISVCTTSTSRDASERIQRSPWRSYLFPAAWKCALEIPVRYCQTHSPTLRMPASHCTTLFRSLGKAQHWLVQQLRRKRNNPRWLKCIATTIRYILHSIDHKRRPRCCFVAEVPVKELFCVARSNNF